MGIEVPAELAGIAERVGLRWPEADEDAMRAQAQAWRGAESALGTLAVDADGTAEGALGLLDGRGADAARQLWSRFVETDTGHLTGAARGAGQAAQRLEHAAEQIGAAKVEMLRGLADTAKNEQAARSAAAEGNQHALLGIDQMLRGAAVNLNAVHEQLVRAVSSTSERVELGVAPVVRAGPGAHDSQGQAGLLGVATGLPRELVESALDTATSTAQHAGGVVREVSGQAQQATRDVGDRIGREVSDELGAMAPDNVERAGTETVQHLEQAVPRVARAAESLEHDVTGQPAEHPSPAPVAVGESEPATGPLALGEPTPRAVPAAGVAYDGLLRDGRFDEAPTPSSGMPLGPAAQSAASSGTTAAGFADGADAPAPAPARAPHVAAAPGASSVSGYPVGTGSAAPGPSAGPSAGAAATSGQAPGGGTPPRHGIAGVRGAVMPADPVRGQARAGTAAPAPVQPAQGTAALPPRQPAPHGQQAPRAQPAPPRPEHGTAPRQQDRQSVVALFLVHMFPIGHLPVPSTRPARQLPVPAQEADYAAGMRFPPHDHPDSALVDPWQALRALEAGARVPQAPPAEVLPAPPEELTAGYDPLAGASEHEWERRYVARPDAVALEYAWPPGEMYPEGGRAPGEAVVLAEGTLLDRFGTAHGRIFAADGTPYSWRSLPPSHLRAGYRRYRVLRELPMWLACTAGWFGQPGGGPRYRATYSAAELVTLGFLADVTFQEGGHER